MRPQRAWIVTAHREDRPQPVVLHVQADSALTALDKSIHSATVIDRAAGDNGTWAEVSVLHEGALWDVTATLDDSVPPRGTAAPQDQSEAGSM